MSLPQIQYYICYAVGSGVRSSDGNKKANDGANTFVEFMIVVITV